MPGAQAAAMAEAYSVFANGGHRILSSLIQRVVDDKGRVLFEAPNLVLDESSRTLDERNAFLMSSLLQEVTRSGTAAPARGTLKRADRYGISGTSHDSLEAWFAGYQPELVTVVWVGYDQPRKLGSRETGGGLALPIWIDFMQYALRNTAVAEIQAPEGVVNVNGEWFFDEYVGNQGVSRIENDDPNLPAPANAEEKKGILDLFKQ